MTLKSIVKRAVWGLITGVLGFFSQLVGGFWFVVSSFWLGATNKKL